MIDPVAGSQLSVAESLTNMVWAPITDGIKGISLSANWMWPAKNEGENARLYEAVEGLSDFVCDLGINIPTGKDSMSMTQKYADDVVYAPGTVIISAVGEVDGLAKVVEPVLKKDFDSTLIYVDLSGDDFKLGGSSFAQVVGQIGDSAPTVKSAANFSSTFDYIQSLIKEGKILAGHDVSAGGLITALLEMTFAQVDLGIAADLKAIAGADDIEIFFSEKPALIIQVAKEDTPAIVDQLTALGTKKYELGAPIGEPILSIQTNTQIYL